ncbi:DUF3515 domain-containing protein [Lipingzhangella sp. LS1_29]|uniref:DUF3515 domain-containing protein n=1 Tax=Lipingzhangella rawalii TaxID=2055835 RepID=A0ABU2H5R3_9ACTN|nr:DUF3515 domain-containing protein [Lipingzhangella rawalii]MDS1270638.1 DUF3515 domain-containing protein [Lipingzhangella rawalii]
MRRVLAPLTGATALLLAACGAPAGTGPPPELDDAAAELCRDVVDAVPDTLYGEDRVPTEPESDFTTAWGDPPITLRCGVDRPDAYAPDSELQVVNDVAWLPEPEGSAEPHLFTALGHEVYVELAIPAVYGVPAQGLVAVSDVIGEIVPERTDGDL